MRLLPKTELSPATFGFFPTDTILATGTTHGQGDAILIAKARGRWIGIVTTDPCKLRQWEEDGSFYWEGRECYTEKTTFDLIKIEETK